MIHLQAEIVPAFDAAIKRMEATEASAVLTQELRRRSMLPPAAGSLQDLKSAALRAINSSQGNLNLGPAHENQGIELVRGQMARLRGSLHKDFGAATDVPSLQALKDRVLREVAPSDSTAPKAVFANEVRATFRAAVEKAPSTIDVVRLIHDFQYSTGLDLSRKPGAKDQTRAALDLSRRLNLIARGESSLPAEKQLLTVFEVLDLPREPAAGP